MHRGLLKVQLRACLFHCAFQIGNQLTALPVEEQHRPPHRLCVVLAADPPHAGCRATTDLVLQTGPAAIAKRSEEHTSELQSLMRISYAVFCLKKKHTKNSLQKQHTTTHDQQ